MEIPSAHKLYPRCPVSATPTHMLRICVNPRLAFICGRADNACTNLLGFLVRYVRTRGSMRFRRVAKLPIFTTLPRAARTCHARLVRLTRARGRRFLRGRKALLNDFWYFWSRKSTIKEKFLYVSSRANNVRPYHAGRRRRRPLSRRRQHTCFAYVLIPLQDKTQA